MTEVVIVAARRTAIGNFGGSLSSVPAPELGATVIKALLAQTGVKPEQVSEVIMGQILTAGVGQNPARQALIKAGIPVEVPAMTINQVCGSGLKAVVLLLLIGQGIVAMPFLTDDRIHPTFSYDIIL